MASSSVGLFNLSVGMSRRRRRRICSDLLGALAHMRQTDLQSFKLTIDVLFLIIITRILRWEIAILSLEVPSKSSASFVLILIYVMYCTRTLPTHFLFGPKHYATPMLKLNLLHRLIDNVACKFVFAIQIRITLCFNNLRQICVCIINIIIAKGQCAD